MSRLVVVSNRVGLPTPGKTVSGGLAVGLHEALQEQGGLWFGGSGNIAPASEYGVMHSVTHDKVTFVTADLTQQEYDDYYLGFSNSILWPLAHHVLGFMDYNRAQYDTYCAVNARFAELLKPLLRPDDVIWVHDYHFIPLAHYLRKLGVQNKIGFFLHVPFAGFELFRSIPVYRELLSFYSQYELVGFQTASDGKSFVDSMVRGLGAERQFETPDRVLTTQVNSPTWHCDMTYGARKIRAGAFPIGIDVDAVQDAAVAAQTDPQIGRVKESVNRYNLVIGADRLDYSKGLIQRCRGFETWLRKHPERCRQNVFMQIATPSRTDHDTYRALRRELEETAGNINGEFAEFDWTPIRYFYQNVPRDLLMGFFRAANVGLVTSLRDGMNLVAKEFIAAQDPSDPGVLVLSDLTGAAVELPEAILVNPYDIDGIAEGLEMAINLPKSERIERHQRMLERLQSNNISIWRQRFVQNLMEIDEPVNTTQTQSNSTFEMI